MQLKPLPTQYECLKKVRKMTVRPGNTFKVKKQYIRKNKWGNKYD